MRDGVSGLGRAGCAMAGRVREDQRPMGAAKVAAFAGPGFAGPGPFGRSGGFAFNSSMFLALGLFGVPNAKRRIKLKNSKPPTGNAIYGK